MKQFALVSFIALGLLAVLALPAWSQTSDGVEAVVTPFSIAVTIDDATINFGDVQLSAAPDSPSTANSPTAVTVRNVGSSAADLTIQGSNAIAADDGDSDWTLDCTDQNGTVGVDTFALLFARGDINVDFAALGNSLCPSTPKTLQQNVPGGQVGILTVMFQIHMPTMTTGFGPRTSNVVVTATQAQ